MKWLIEDNIFPENQNKIIQACEKAGIEYLILDNSGNIPPNITNEYIFYGSINKAFLLKRLTPAQIWIDNFDCSRYYPLITSKDILFNSDYILLPYGSLISRAYMIYSMFLHDRAYEDKLFIRPNSGFKQFTGFSVSYTNFAKEIKNIRMFDHELVLISSDKNIEGAEYRGLVCNNKLITYKKYIDNDSNIDGSKIEFRLTNFNQN